MHDVIVETWERQRMWGPAVEKHQCGGQDQSVLFRVHISNICDIFLFDSNFSAQIEAFPAYLVSNCMYRYNRIIP